MGGHNKTEQPTILSGRAVIYLLIVLGLLIPPLFIFGYEFLRTRVFETIPSWKSNLITDLFIWFATALPALFIAHKAIRYIRELESGIQKQKKTEDNLQFTEAKFAALFQTCPIAMVLIDAETATPVDINKAFTTQFGWSREEVVGKDTLATCIWADISKRSFFLDLLKTKTHVENHRAEFLTKARQHRTISLFADFVNVADQKYFLICGYDLTDGMESENKLRTSEQRYRRIFENSAMGIFQSVPEGRYLTVNPALAKMLGYDSAEEIISSVTDIGRQIYVDPDERNALMERIKKDGTVIVETRLRRKDGSSLWAVNSVKSVYDDQHCFLYFEGFILDITEFKLAEKALMESEERFKTLTNSAPIGIALINRDSSAVYVNPHFTGILGYTVEDLQPQTGRWYELSYPDPEYRKQALAAWATAFETQGITERTFRVCCKNRQYKIIHFCVTPMNDGRMLLTCEDITEQKKIQDALRDSEEQLRLALECGNIALVDYDFEKESIYLSPQYYRQMGYTPDELNITVKNWPDLIHPDDRPQVLSTFKRHLNTGGESYYEAIYRMKTKDGSWKWIFDRGGIVRRDAQGKPSRMIGVHLDITASKQAEDAFRESERRMADIIDFLPDATFAIDREGKVLAWNRAMVEMTGKTKEEMLGQGNHAYGAPFYGSPRPILIDLVFKDRKDIENKYLYVTRKNDFLFAEVNIPELHKQKGVTLWGIAAPLYDEKGTIVGAIESIRDITDRRQAENALREALERSKEMEFIISHSPVTLWLWKATPDWPVEYVTENVATFGYSPEDFTSGRVSFASIVHAEDLARVSAEVEVFAREGQPEFTQEYRIVTKSGDIRWVDDRTWVRRNSDGQISHFQGIIVDITGRKKAEEALKESEARYRTFINSTTDMAYVKDEQFRHVIANQALLDFFGKTEAEVIGKTDYELMPRTAASSCRATDEEARRSGHVVVSEEYIAEKYYETYKFPVSIGPDKKGVGGYIRDITYRKRAEEVIQNYQKELRELASQLSLTEEKQRRAIATEVHDGIGQLLSMSKLRLQQVIKQGPDPRIRSEIEDALSMLVQALKDSRSLIFQLSPPILYELGFVPAVEWLVEQFQSRHSSIHFSCDTEGVKFDLPLDTRIILFQAIRELLYNIVKHAEAKNARITITRDFDQVQIVVSDDGKGYTAHLKTRNSGFGLFSIHERLAHFGGRLEITGNPGKGTKVVISTPVKMPGSDKE